jgi:hypothetical protein
MSDGPRPGQGVTEGSGAYNRDAAPQAAGIAQALRSLERAARAVDIGAADQPFVIADYGASQGKNSLAPMRVAIAALRARVGVERPISVVHVDVPANDFSTLFAVVETDPDSYVHAAPNVFPAAVGRSFYGRVFPDAQVHLGWSSYAAVWLSHIPATIPGHFFPPCATGAARQVFARQGAEDWEAFLSLRAAELRHGGRLVVVLPGLDEAGDSELNAFMDEANAVIAEMVADGVVSDVERARMTIGSYPRRKDDLLAPFQQDRIFRQLVVESCDVAVIEDPSWATYRQHGDAAKLAGERVMFFRSTFMPSLATALDGHRSADSRREFADQLADRLKRRVTPRPTPMPRLAQTIVLAKT